MNVTVVVNMLAVLIWLLFAGLIFFAIARASRQRPVKGISAAIIIAGVSALVLSTLSAGLVFVPPQERAVVLSAVAPKGYREEALQPGLNWIIPFMESTRSYSISKETYTMSIAVNEGAVQGDDSITARTSDGQEIYIDASVIYAVDPNKVIDVHIAWQDRYPGDFVRPQARGIIRNVISQYKVEEVITSKRDEITKEINDVMRSKMADNGLLLSEFVLRNVTFSQDYAASIEQKQISEQRAQQARLVVEQKKQEAEQARQEAQGVADAAVIAAKGQAEGRLIQAEAEAKALEMLSQVLKDNPNLVQYLFVNKIATGVQTIFLPNNGNYLLPLPNASSIPQGAGNPDSLFPAFPTPIPTPMPTPAPTPTP
jgi:regulator of protease activity HflC (stomatin/prohibitin superfamily)